MNTVYNGKFLQVIEKPYNNINYEIVEMKPAVAAFLVNQNFTKTLLVKQFRPVVNDFTYEIPAGMLDVSGEDKIDTIIRELIEEVNLEVDKENLIHLTKYYPIIGSVTHQIDLYYAVVEEVEDKEIKNDDVVERIWINLDNFENLINEGKIIDGKTLLAYYMMKDKAKNEIIRINSDKKILVGYEYGKEIYKSIEDRIQLNKMNTIVFSDNIENVSISFVQGFLEELVEKIGIERIQEVIEIKDNQTLNDKFIKYSMY